MGKKADNIKRIIELLGSGPKTKEEIIQSIGMGSDSWQKYRGEVSKTLTAMGKELRLKNKKYSIVISEESDISQKNEYDADEENYIIRPATNRTIREIVVMNIMSQYSALHSDSSVSIGELAKEYSFLKNEEYEGADYTSVIKQIMDIDGKNTKGLVSKGYVKKYKNNRYELTSKAPVYMKKSGDVFFDIKDAVRNGGDGYAFPEVMKDIDDLMSLINDEDKYDAGRYYSRIGIRGNKKIEIERFIKKLNKVNYKERALAITYGNDNSFVFRVGLVVYATDKDRLYFFGKKCEDDSDITILNTEKIKKMVETDESNNIFRAPELISIYNEMFSVSTEEPFMIRVEFDNVFSIKEKLQHLVSVRPNARIRLAADGSIIIYEEERVRGIEDVGKWLRSFGKSIRVVEPEALRIRMKESIDLTLAEYGEEASDE